MMHNVCLYFLIGGQILYNSILSLKNVLNVCKFCCYWLADMSFMHNCDTQMQFSYIVRACQTAAFDSTEFGNLILSHHHVNCRNFHVCRAYISSTGMHIYIYINVYILAYAFELQNYLKQNYCMLHSFYQVRLLWEVV